MKIQFVYCEFSLGFYKPQTIQAKLQFRIDCANHRQRPVWNCRFKVGDSVKARAGLIQQLHKKSVIQFLTKDGYCVNTRHLKFIDWPSEVIPLLTEQERQRRYPSRKQKSVDHFQPD